MKKDVITPRKFSGSPLEHYEEVLTYLEPFCDSITFLKLLNISMMREMEIDYVKTYETLPYYQYKLEKMIRKTDPVIQVSLSDLVNRHLQSIRNVKDGALERTLNKTSALLDLFFIVRLFENFTVVPNQPSGPITRVIAYVGVAHVDRIERVLRSWAKSRVITYKDHKPYITPLNGKPISIFNIAQCITIPLQVVHRQSPETEKNPYGSSLVLPESLEYVDIDRRPAIYLDESRKYVIDELQLLNIDMNMAVDKNKKRYETYLSLPMYSQSRFNTLLSMYKDESESLFELLDNNHEDIPQLIDALSLSGGLEFTFGKKKTKKSAKKTKKSAKKTKKSAKKTKKSVKKTKKSVKKTKKSVKKTGQK